MGLPGIILQGTATLAMAAREIVNREASGNPRRLEGLACRFSGMVRPGTSIRICRQAYSDDQRGRDLFFDILGEDERPVIKQGWAFVRSPESTAPD